MNPARPVTLVAAAATALLCGCANPINATTAQHYFAWGAEAERAGNFPLAEWDYSRAYRNAEIGILGPEAEASYLYEEARVLGYMGNYDRSEAAFLQVLKLIDKANGDADRLRAPALAEYSRLLHDTGQHAKAVPVFERALVELDKRRSESTDPLAYAAFLDEYAESLNATGLAERASAISARSAKIKAENPNSAPHFQARSYKS